MTDLKARMTAVRDRRFKKIAGYRVLDNKLRTVNRIEGDCVTYSFDKAALEALRRAEAYFGTDCWFALATAMAEVLFPAGRGRKKGLKRWDENRHFELARAYFEVKRVNPRIGDDGKVAEIISEHPNFNEYRNHSELLRQRFGKAKRLYSLVMDYQVASMAKLGVEPKIIEEIQSHFDRRRGASGTATKELSKK
jgi:hypothetical protein